MHQAATGSIGTGHSRVAGQFAAADGVDHHAAELGESSTLSRSSRSIGTPPKPVALDPQEADLVVLLKRHKVAGTDVDAVGFERHFKLALHGFGLADFLAGQAVAAEHVQKVGVPAGVELIGAVDFHAALVEEPGQGAMGNGGADLRLDVVADTRNSGAVNRAAHWGSETMKTGIQLISDYASFKTSLGVKLRG